MRRLVEGGYGSVTKSPRAPLAEQQIWDAYGDRTTVAVHIRRLREKIEEDPAAPRFIVTVWGVGYRFEGTRR